MKKALYAYFGLLGPHDIDIPGHTFYQPFLLEEILVMLGMEEKNEVDFFSYLPYRIKSKDACYKFSSKLVAGYPTLLQNYIYDKLANMIGDYNDGEWIIPNVDNYSVLILKARFRNPSTFAKKYYDTAFFEFTLDKGHKSNIPTFIVDTDLSLPSKFIDKINNMNNVHIISLGNPCKAYPNLNPKKIFPKTLRGITAKTLSDITEIYRTHSKSELFFRQKENLLAYYGNIASANYKVGHTKNIKILNYLLKIREDTDFSVNVIGKIEESSFLMLPNTKRYDRIEIGKILSKSKLNVNISKDLYVDAGFWPARISEACVFGSIPISYKGKFPDSLTFSDYHRFKEICKFYEELEPIDFKNMYIREMGNLIKYLN
ncbi:MAG: hypothetical protein WC503_01090 [Candidatus Shapirobacteria bacterium]